VGKGSSCLSAEPKSRLIRGFTRGVSGRLFYELLEQSQEPTAFFALQQNIQLAIVKIDSLAVLAFIDINSCQINLFHWATTLGTLHSIVWAVGICLRLGGFLSIFLDQFLVEIIEVLFFLAVPRLFQIPFYH